MQGVLVVCINLQYIYISRSNIKSLPNSTWGTPWTQGCNVSAPFRFFFFPLLDNCFDEFPALSSCNSALDGFLASSSVSLGSLLSWTVGLKSPLLQLFDTFSSKPVSLFSFSSSVFLSLSRSFSASPSEFSLSLARRSWQRFLFRVLRWFFLRWPSMLELVLKVAFQNAYLISH